MTKTRDLSNTPNNSVNVREFGAVGNGVADDTTAFQSALAAITNSQTPSLLEIPAGTYKITSGLTVNLGYVSIFGNRAVLDFSTIGDVPALTFVGGNPVSGNPWNQADSLISGLKIVGLGTGVGTGLYLYENTPGLNLGPSHSRFCNLNVIGFKHGVRMGSRSYLATFDACDIQKCTIGFIHPSTNIDGSPVQDSGENIRFNNGTIYSCDTAFELDFGPTTYSFSGTSFDYCSGTLINIKQGQASFVSCHFEGPTRALKIAINSFVTCSGCFFLHSSSGGAIDKYIENDGFLSIIGGRLIPFTGDTNFIYSSSTGRTSVVGSHVQSLSPPNLNINGNSLEYFPNDNKLNVSGSVETGLALSGVFAGNNTTEIPALSSDVSLDVANAGGLFIFRDQTSGGTAVYAADSSAGPVEIHNGIGGFSMTYAGGQMNIRVNSGTVPRAIRWAFLRTNAG